MAPFKRHPPELYLVFPANGTQLQGFSCRGRVKRSLFGGNNFPGADFMRFIKKTTI
jgi:hypothetical protein